MRILLLMVAVVTVCYVGPHAEAAELFWNDEFGIHRFESDGATSSVLLYETFDTRGIAVDAAHDRLLWSDVLPIAALIPGGVIRAGSTRGGELTNVVTRLTWPAGVALDTRRDRVYWTDLGDANNPSAVFTANADGTDAHRLISGPWLSEIAGIALDLPHEKLYFTYVNPLIDSLFPGGIARSDLDGSNIEPVLSGLGQPLGIAIDSAGGGVYWADARKLSPAGGFGAIQAADLDGQHLRTILGGLDLPFGVALDLVRRDIYWTDMGTGKIQKTVMSGILPFFQDVLTGLKNPTALAIPRASFIPGDANGDDRVDRADVAIVAENHGRTGLEVGWFDGDFDGDHRVSLEDLAILQSQVGNGGPPATIDTLTAVPEPPTGLLAAVAALWAMALAFRRPCAGKG